MLDGTDDPPRPDTSLDGDPLRDAPALARTLPQCRPTQHPPMQIMPATSEVRHPFVPPHPMDWNRLGRDERHVLELALYGSGRAHVSSLRLANAALALQERGLARASLRFSTVRHARLEEVTAELTANGWHYLECRQLAD